MELPDRDYHHPLFSIILQVLSAGLWTGHLASRNDYDSILSGYMIGLLEFPLQWSNERFGPLWRINTGDTARKVREGFPYEEPTLFFLGGSLLCTLTKDFSSSLLRKWFPSLLVGIGGGTIDNWLSHTDRLELEPPYGPAAIPMIYALGTFSILSFRDQNRENQLLILLTLLLMAYLTRPAQEDSVY